MMGSMDRDRPGARGDRIVESVWGVPAPALRPFIAGYAGFRQAGVPPATHRGLPSPYLTAIFTLDDLLTIAAHADPRQPPARYRSLVGGLHTSPGIASSPNDEVGPAWRRVVASGGHCTVSELAAETGWSDRHLRSKFSAE